MIQNAGTWRLVNYSDFSWFIRIDRKVENLDILGMLALIFVGVHNPFPRERNTPAPGVGMGAMGMSTLKPKKYGWPELPSYPQTHFLALLMFWLTHPTHPKTILRIWAFSWTQRNGGKDSPLATWRKHRAYGDYGAEKKATHCNPIAIPHEIKWNPSACEVHKIRDPSKWETANF